MADILDQADDAQEAFMRDSLSRRKPVPAATAGIGMCLNCGAAVQGDARWCDVPCRDDWERNAAR